MSNMQAKQKHRDRSANKAAANVKTGSKDNKAQQDEFLNEALEETFPGSDPVASMRFTQDK